MSYDVELTPQAEDDLRSIADLDPLLASYVLDQLDRLALDPVGLSRRGGFPYLPGQRFEFWSPDGYRIIVLFRYAAGESTLVILDVGYIAPPGPRPEP